MNPMETPKVRHSLKTITPAVASALINRSVEHGVKNRKVNQKLVNRYAKAMLEGDWKINGKTVVLDEQGCILDGQHRLYACVQANVPFTTSFVENAPRDSFDTIDCGRPRSASQILEMEGIKYYNTIASIIYGVEAIRQAGQIGYKKADVANVEVRDQYLESKKQLDKIAAIIAPICQVTKMMTPKMAGSIFFYLVHDLKQPWAKVEEFITGIISEESSANPYINAMRKFNFRNLTTKVADRTRYGYIVLTWNAMVSGAKMPCYKERYVEEIPEFIKA